MSRSSKPAPKFFRILPYAAAGLLIVGLAISQVGCSATYENRDPTGEPFPRVTGKNLKEQPVTLPDDLAGGPAVILIGYKQRDQFDIDRWFMGLIQADAPARIVELPTIPGIVPSIASGWIDDGMRSGIPEEDWPAVVTLYGDSATPVAKLTGNEGPNARVLVLDASGEIVWFTDRGYSATQGLEVARVTRALAETE